MRRIDVSTLCLFWCVVAALESAAQSRSDGGVLFGIVRTTDGLSVSGAQVALTGVAGSRWVVSGSGGEYRVEGLPAGVYTVSITHPAYRLAEKVKTIVSGRTRLDLAVERVEPETPREPGSLFGVVTTSDGGQAPAIVLTLVGPAGRLEAVTDETGEYRFESLHPGDYRLFVMGQTFSISPSDEFELGPGHAMRRDVTLSLHEIVQVTAARPEITPTASAPGMSTRTIEAEAIEAREASSLVAVMRDVPGVAIARYGGVGSQTDAYLRGGASNYALVLIDGLPANDPGGAFDFGKLLPFEIGRVEVTRGAASSIYGGALSGVVHLTTRQAGADETRAFASAEAGSFSWNRFQGGTSGRTDLWDWNVGVIGLQTDNEVPNNAFSQIGAAGSLGAKFSDDTSLRMIFRGESNAVGTPGPTSLVRPDLDASDESDRIVVGATVRHEVNGIEHLLRGGISQSNKLSLNPEDSGPIEIAGDGDNEGLNFIVPDFAAQDGIVNDTTRFNAAYQANAERGQHLFSYGGELEYQSGNFGAATTDTTETDDSGGRPAFFAAFLQQSPTSAPTRSNFAGFLQDRIVLGTIGVLTVGGRVERNGSFGTDFMPRASVAVTPISGVTFKSSAGIGLKEPSLEQSFGGGFRVQGNPDLLPERSRTLDAGVRVSLFQGRVWSEGTAFYHQYRDQIVLGNLDFEGIRERSGFAELSAEERRERFEAIQAGEAPPFNFEVDFDAFRPSYTNLGKTRGQGFEVSFGVNPVEAVSLRGDYTFLSTLVLEGNQEFEEGDALPNRPRHQLSLTADGTFGPVRLGATFLHLSERRAEADFVTLALGLTTVDAYTRFDFRTRVELGRGLETYVVAENLLDIDYEEVLGYPALGRSIRMGVRWDFDWR